jgi:hypothetical protein
MLHCARTEVRAVSILVYMLLVENTEYNIMRRLKQMESARWRNPRIVC